MRYSLLSIWLLIVGFTNAQDVDTLWNNANSHYANKEYSEAISLYDSIQKTDVYSAELYFNKANAFYKSNQLGDAILYYEKALKLNPKDENILHNLNFSNQSITDKSNAVTISPIKEVLYSNGSSNLYGLVSSLFLFLLFTVIIVFILKRYNTKIFYSLISFCVVFILLFTGLACQQEKLLKNQNMGIITSMVSNIKTEPIEDTSDAFILHEGSKVEIIETTDNWSKIIFNGKNIGWIKNTHFEII